MTYLCLFSKILNRLGSLSVKDKSQHVDNLKGVKTLKPVKNGHEFVSLSQENLCSPYLNLPHPLINSAAEADTSYSDSKSLLLAAFSAPTKSAIILQLVTRRAEPPVHSHHQ